MAVNRKKRKLNDRGAALVSVLVVTMFITILATTMLYMAAMNYQQKLTDYQNKESFYEAEKALDELKSLMVQDLQEAYVYAYNKTSGQLLLLKTGDARRDYFQDRFMEKLNQIWFGRVKQAKSADSTLDDAKALVAAVRSVMTAKGGAYAAEAGCIYKVDNYGVYEIADSSGGGAATSRRKFVLKGVQAKAASVSAAGTYTTFLYTDICLEPPAVDWSTDGFIEFTGTAAQERDKIAFTDYVSYINWHKADYDESDNYDTQLGTRLDLEPESESEEP